MKVAKREPVEVLTDSDDTSLEVKEEISSSVPVVNNFTEKSNTESVYTIRLNRKHSCYIGGKYYVFEKNKVYQVPSDVKRILSVAGLLAPL